MKNKSNFLISASILGGLLFNYLFWMERLALNLLIFSLFIIAINWLNDEIAKSTKFKLYALAHLMAGILVVINNSDLTLVTYYISFLLFTGYAHHQKIRSVFYAFFESILQFVVIPFTFLQQFSHVTIGKFNLKPLSKIIKYVFLPFIIVTIFTVTYMVANEVFAHYVDTVMISIGDFLEQTFSFIFKDISIQRIMFSIFGIGITAALIITFKNNTVENYELSQAENHIRSRNTKQTILFQFADVFIGSLLRKKTALKTEYIIGLLSFAALNLLLLSVNLIDITTIWFGYKPSGNFSADLHQGTNALIFSIVLAMAVILYFFRGNLNFYSKSKTLRTLAFIWMVQNLILIISVFIRDGYYIEYHGLTYKRIGVLVFAVLCIIGLATVYIKVARQKTLFYLFKTNGAIWYALLIAFSIINWDVFIVKYNLNHVDTLSIDLPHLLSFSDKTLPELDKNRKKLMQGSNSNPKQLLLINQLDERIGFFKERYESVGWLSWNLQDYNAAEYFGLEK